jgi:hypothetical protein
MTEQKQIGRHTAYKVWIKDIHNNKEAIDQNTGFPYLPVKDKKVVRLNIFGSVVDKFTSEAYATIVLDDSSGSVRLRVWADDLYMFENIEVGDLVFIVGRWAEYKEEKYVRPEVVRKISIDWALLRRLELSKEYGVPSKEDKVVVKVESSDVKEVEPTLAAREAVLSIIDKKDEASAAEVCHESGISMEKIELAVNDLLKEGEIFAPRQGVYRLV